MGMIVNASDGFCDTLKVANNAAEIGMKPFTPRRGDMWDAIFRAKKQCDSEARYGLKTWGDSSRAPAGAQSKLTSIPVAYATS